MKTEIYLVRHSEPLKAKINETTNKIELNNELIPLSLNGEKKAKRLSESKIFKNISVVISSNYIRAIDTAKYIVEKNNCQFIIDNRLSERKLGTEYKEKNFWLKQMLDPTAKTKDGENQNEVRTRMLKVIKDVLDKYPGQKIVLVSHAAAMTFLLMNWCKLEEVELETKRRKLTFNSQIIINDKFNTPDVFKLTFKNKKLISIKHLKKKYCLIF